MSKKKEKKSGAEAFDEYYSELFGQRWEQLKISLYEPSRQCEYSKNLLMPYYLDYGSVRAAAALPLEGAEYIADMCAAPGGKSLVIASRMEKQTVLVSNERSRDRKNRLQKVLDQHLPDEIRKRVHVTGYDAARWCVYEKEVYDRILLDVPCSSERHVLCEQKYLELWTPARIRNLSAAQWSILSSAFLTLKNGGYMVYSTCALSHSENDDVVARLLKKYPQASIVPLDPEKNRDFEDIPFCSGERTLYGIHVLPDVQQGAGPLYFSLISKS